MKIIPEFVPSVEKELKSFPEVQRISFLTGRYDAIAELKFHTVGDALNFIHTRLISVEGIKYTESLFELPPL